VSEPVEGEVAGYNFTRLAERYPDLHKELLAFKQTLADTSNELKPLKVWQIQGVCLIQHHLLVSCTICIIQHSPLVSYTVSLMQHPLNIKLHHMPYTTSPL